MVMSGKVRILLLADTHLGFDLPFKPRIERRRRGHDFFSNFELALEPALRGEVDLVVHGGDLLFRTRIPDALVEMALNPLLRVADAGVPVYLVPGNHERSRIPLQIWTVHPNLHIFHQPETFLCQVAGYSIALAGFPFARNIRDEFRTLVAATGYLESAADIHLLCIHQAVEGATVGPSNYTFRRGSDVIQGRDIPAGFTAVLSGHIHRSQMLTHDLYNRPLPAPVIYPGSVERTAFAERFEEKHYVILNIDLSRGDQSPGVDVSFVPLPARPMVVMEIDAGDLNGRDLSHELGRRLLTVDPEAVVQVRIKGADDSDLQGRLTAAKVRSMAPATMNVTLRFQETEPVSGSGPYDPKA